MLFDRLCRVIERNFPKETVGNGIPNMRLMVEDARIFEIEGKESYPLDVHQDPNFIEQTFSLPFHTVAIEDELGCIILQDVETRAMGMKAERWFINFRPVYSPVKRPGAFAQLESPQDIDAFYYKWKEQYQCDFRDCYDLTAGIVNRRWFETNEGKLGSVMSGRLGRELFCTKDRIIADFNTIGDFINTMQFPEEAIKRAMEAIEPAYEHIIYINSPAQFIVEETPVRKSGWEAPRVALMRSIDRPKYILVPGTEIRKKLGLSGKPHIPGEKRGPLTEPLERRGHYRYFKSDRYSEERRRKPKWINSYWVGPHEATVGKKHYRVILDR